jgi:hypothetical protein
MPEKKTLTRAKRDLARGKSASTAAGEFVREEMDHIRQGKHGARSTKQAVAIGLSKARRAGVPLQAPEAGQASEQTRRAAERDVEVGQGTRKRRPSTKRRRASTRALEREPRAAASKAALSRHAKATASKRRAKKTRRTRATAARGGGGATARRATARSRPAQPKAPLREAGAELRLGGPRAARSARRRRLPLRDVGGKRARPEATRLSALPHPRGVSAKPGREARSPCRRRPLPHSGVNTLCT